MSKFADVSLYFMTSGPKKQSDIIVHVHIPDFIRHGDEPDMPGRIPHTSTWKEENTQKF